MALTTVDRKSAGSLSTVDRKTNNSISTIHPDIIRTHILTRLDGPALASAASTSSNFQTLCSDQSLWRQISIATWPSINDPRVLRLVSTFPAGFRSFFADSYPLIDHPSPAISTPPEELISAVDLYYRGELIYSKIQDTKTEIRPRSGWFMSSPFRIDILELRESIPTWIRYPGGDYDLWVSDMEENMTLNWILIDPTGKRAANISSGRSASARRNWLTGDLELSFVAVAAADGVEIAMVVACGSAEAWKEVDEEVGGEVHVRNVRLQVEDKEGKCLNEKDSMVILQRFMRGKRVVREGKERLMKTVYKEYVEVKKEWRKEWREKQEKRERVKDTSCVVFGFALFIVIWFLILFT